MPVLNAHIKPNVSSHPEAMAHEIYESKFQIPYRHSLGDAINSAKDQFVVAGYEVVFPHIDSPEELLSMGAPEVIFHLIGEEKVIKGELVLSVSD